MQTPLDQAILVLLVGMCSVFIILGLIVLSGQLLIRLINRYFPVAIEQKVKRAPLPQPITPQNDFESLAAITAAVQVFTRGKGRIEKIEKMNS